MNRYVRRLFDATERGLVSVLDVASMLLMASLLGVVSYSILARQILLTPAAWTQEVAAGLAVWMVSCGAAVAWSRGAHIVIDTFAAALKGVVRTWAFRLVQGASLIFFLLTVVGSYRMMLRSGYTLTGALRISYSYLYLGIFIGGFAMTYISLVNIIRGRSLEDTDSGQGAW